jgi:hypothetical protein
MPPVKMKKIPKVRQSGCSIPFRLVAIGTPETAARIARGAKTVFYKHRYRVGLNAWCTH